MLDDCRRDRCAISSSRRRGWGLVRAFPDCCIKFPLVSGDGLRLGARCLLCASRACSTRVQRSITSGCVSVWTSCLCRLTPHCGHGICSVSELSTVCAASSAHRRRRKASKQTGQNTCAHGNARMDSPPLVGLAQTVQHSCGGLQSRLGVSLAELWLLRLAPATGSMPFPTAAASGCFVALLRWPLSRSCSFTTSILSGLKTSKDSHRGSTMAGTKFRWVLLPPLAFSGRGGLGDGNAAPTSLLRICRRTGWSSASATSFRRAEALAEQRPASSSRKALTKARFARTPKLAVARLACASVSLAESIRGGALLEDAALKTGGTLVLLPDPPQRQFSSSGTLRASTVLSRALPLETGLFNLLSCLVPSFAPQRERRIPSQHPVLMGCVRAPKKEPWRPYARAPLAHRTHRR